MPKTFAMQQQWTQSYLSSLDAYVECADEYNYCQSNGRTGSAVNCSDGTGSSTGSGSDSAGSDSAGIGSTHTNTQEKLFENRYTYEKMEQRARCSMMARITDDEGWLMDPEDDEEKPRLGGSPGDGLRLTKIQFSWGANILFLFCFCLNTKLMCLLAKT